AIRVIANPPPKNLSLKKRSKTNDFEVVYVGRVTRTKGMPVLMKAIPLILKEVPEAKFTLIGGDAGNPEGFNEKVNWLKSMLPAQAKDAVDFKGYLTFDDFSSYLEHAAVAVIPSLFDNFPYTCLELMSFAKAIVSSDQGGMVEMLDNGNCGRLFSPPNHQELADKIIELLKNPELRQELGDLAQKRVLEEYNKDKIMIETVEYYKQCIDEL
ncbi:MAG TPA: glycosyltransferase family 1 protein, partial [Trueperaceae bacterium]|nr:glycosyltransferase family 1 protein [Trueperaceae bacterium]